MRTKTRDAIVNQITARLSMPRVQISVILALTALAAFAMSVVMLRFGVTSMAARYAVAVIFGYCIFLLLLRIWIWLQSEDRTVDLDPGGIGDVYLPNISIGGGSGNVVDKGFGGGGDFAGAGAGGSWADDNVPTPIAAPLFNSSSSTASSSSISSGGGFDVDLDDGIALLVVVVVILLVFSSLIYVVWIAPILLAELIIDAAIVSSFYRPVKDIERRYWLFTAIKKTAIPAAAVLILVVIAGFVMEIAEPNAVTIGQFLETISN